jgi:serine/threonine protein kinase
MLCTFQTTAFENNFLTMQRGRFLIELSPITQDTRRIIAENTQVARRRSKLSVDTGNDAKCKIDIPCQEELSSPIRSPQYFVVDNKQKLGGGGFGNVYEVRIAGSDNVYAAKEINVRFHDNQTHRDVSNESEVQYKLAKNSKFFPKVICTAFTYHSVIIVMEKVETTLLSYVDERMTNVALVKNCILQLLRGAKEMHEQKIAHMDIKPENIGVSMNNEGELSFKYLDFSYETFRHLDENCMAIPHGSTMEYISPESLLNMDSDEIRCDRSDSWSIGCTILELMTGQRPWELTRGQLMTKLCALDGQHHHPTVPSTIPNGIKDFILDCFKIADERPSPAELLVKYHDMLTQ